MSTSLSRTALAAALALALAGATNVQAASTTVAAERPAIAALDRARTDPGLLILQLGIFDPAVQQLDASAAGAARAQTSAYAIVQFEAGRLGERKALAARGVEFLGYLPNNAYYVRLQGIALDEVNTQPGVRWAGALQPAMKLDPQLWTAARRDSAARRDDGRYEILVRGFAGVSSGHIADALRQAVPGATVTARSERAEAEPYLRAEVEAAQLDALLVAATAIEGVSYVTPWIALQWANSGSVGAIQGNAMGACTGSGTVCGPTPLWDHGLLGSGQIVAVTDSGTTPNMAWFATLDKGEGPHTEVTYAERPTLPNIGTLHPDNKIIGYWTQPGAIDYDFTIGHGTHVTGTVVGDVAGTFGTTTYTASTPLLPNHDLADGMAPNAQLLMQDNGNSNSPVVQDFAGTLEQAYAGGARVHSNSWGAPTGGQYNGNDAAVDATTRRNEGLLVLVAAGNDRSGPSQTNSPGNAKNALSVGALGHAGSTQHAGYSNLGPAADGRVKPDIAAPGSSIVSAAVVGSQVTDTISAPQTRALSGTSMATPTLAGNAVLLRQFFTDGFYPRGEKTAADALHPTGAMMKAVLLNGTYPLTAEANGHLWPTSADGWGRAWLDGNLWFKDTLPGGDDSRRLRLFERTNPAGLETGDVNTYTIENVAAGIELRATLTWFDVEAAASAASVLVNNLDLEVEGPDGSVFLGSANIPGGVSAPGGTADAKDTVEQVRLTTPVAGRYTFRVKATAVPGNGSDGSDRQGYALAVSGAFAMPDTAALPAPTDLAEVEVAGMREGIAIGFTAAEEAQGYQLYRADGSCAEAAPGDFHLVATGTESPLVDVRASAGGRYAYRLRGIHNDVEGEVSACLSLDEIFSDGFETPEGAD